MQLDAMISLGGLHVERGEQRRAAVQLATLEPWTSEPEFTPFRRANLAARVSFERAWEHLSRTLGPDHAAAKAAREKIAEPGHVSRGA